MFERHGTKILKLLGLFTVSLLTFTAGYLTRDMDIIPITVNPGRTGILASDRALFEVMDQILESHVSQPEREDLIYGAIEGMIDSLDDPYTTYFDLEEAEYYQSRFGESYVGIGVRVRIEANVLVIDEVFKDSPAEDAGIRVGDVITHVDYDRITDLSFYEAMSLITGDPGTDVTIGVYRPGVVETIHLTMTRAEITSPTVQAEMIERSGENIGYIQVSSFGTETFEAFAQAITNLEEQEMDSLIIDLRDNGGGQLLTVYYMMNLFLLNDGDPIFSTDYYSNGVHYIRNYVASNETRKEYNIVTIINGNSASASEVFASGMSEHGQYTTVGTTSFGKGTMQTDILISATVGDKLHMTIGKWFTADGNWVAKEEGGTYGITPDVVVERELIEDAYQVFLFDEAPLAFDTVDSRTANVQVILNSMGYELRTDGYFDIETQEAVEDIQRDNGLLVTGALNDDTLNVINEYVRNYQKDDLNDTQLQAAIQYLINNPDPEDLDE